MAARDGAYVNSFLYLFTMLLKSFHRYAWLNAIVLLFACNATKKLQQTAEQSILQKPELANAHIGISLYNSATGNYLFNYQGNKYFVPASNTKIITCYAAMKHLGDSIVGLQYIPTETGITAKFTGDPTLLHPDFKKHPVADFIKQHADDLIITLPEWKTEKYGSGWAWNDYDAAYMPERSAAPVYGNVVRFTKRGNSIVTTPKLFKDSVSIFADLRSDNIRINRPQASNSFQVEKGGSRFTNTEIPFVTNEALSVALLEDSLGKTIQFLDSESIADTVWKKVYSQHTDSLLKPMMHRSDNFYAEQTLLMISQQMLSYMSDNKVIDTLLKTDFANLPQAPRWADGSGLSRYNLFTPQDFVQILAKMKQAFSWKRISTIFPTGGSGTLSGYYKDLNGKLYAKTGTLSGQVALSGFLETAKGTPLIFSVLVNNHQTSATTVRRAVEQFLLQVYQTQ
jgi:D-alanyl-D-alanine carboxypeptidase/D-alanyl-D-alanine-endopeptidase (penicillin-binding protein 4)